MTQHPDLFAALAAPFEPHEIKTRSQGRLELQYVTARTVQNRLDNVLGPENWWDRYHSGGENSIVCELTIRLPDGTTITKCDAGGFAGMADSGDDDKSGYSDAFKRAAVKFGVGRFLYKDGVPSYVPVRAPSPAPSPARNGSQKPRTDWGPRAQNALGRPAATPATVPPPAQIGTRPPRTGPELYRWIMQQQEDRGVGLLEHVAAFGKDRSFPAKITAWSPALVKQAHAEALAAIELVYSAADPDDDAPSYEEATGDDGRWDDEREY
jgi:hypothetical protein